MSDLLPIFTNSFAMWLIIHASFFLVSNKFIQLPLGLLVGILVYIVGSKIFLKSEWNEVVDMIPERLKRKVTSNQ